MLKVQKIKVRDVEEFKHYINQLYPNYNNRWRVIFAIKSIIKNNDSYGENNDYFLAIRDWCYTDDVERMREREGQIRTSWKQFKNYYKDSYKWGINEFRKLFDKNVKLYNPTTNTTTGSMPKNDIANDTVNDTVPHIDTALSSLIPRK